MYRFALVVALLSAPLPIAANDCSIPPLLLTINNNSISGVAIALNRGVAAKFGAGQQVESLRLDFTRNNTDIRNALDCTGNQSVVSQCIGASGGVFSQKDSATFVSTPKESWNVTALDAAPNGDHRTYGYDAVTFASAGANITVNQFPFSVWSDSTSSNRSSLGLGRNSSLLASLLEAGMIPSTQFGLYYGSRSMNKPSDGEMVFGGYNSNRVNGTFTNFSMAISYLDQPCPLQVLMKDVRVTTSNGTSNSLIADGQSTVPACINPVENGFQFTPAMFKAWTALTQHPSNPPSDGSHNYTTQTYPLSNEPLIQDLTIELVGGYKVTIPHYELVSYERGNDAQGLYAVINSSRIQSAVTDNGGRFPFPILGGVFLSQNYLSVDYDRNVFCLAHAITTNDLVNRTVTSTCQGGNHIIAPPIPPPSSTPLPSSTPSATASPGGGLTAAGKLELGLGLAAGVLVVSLGLAIFMFLRRKAHKEKEVTNPVPSATTHQPHPTPQEADSRIVAPAQRQLANVRYFDHMP